MDLKVGFSIPASTIIEELDAEDSTDEEVLEFVANWWDGLSDEERAELVADVKGWEIAENAHFIDYYEDDGTAGVKAEW